MRPTLSTYAPVSTRGAGVALLAVAAAWGASALVAPTAYAATTVAAWQMDETGGASMADSSGNGHGGKLRNVSVGATSPSGRAYSFNGVNSVVTVPDAADLDPGDSTFHVIATVRLDRRPIAPKDFDVVRKGVLATSNNYWKLQIDEAGRANCRFRGPAGDVLVSDGRVLTDGGWHRITCVRTASTVGIDVDGRTTTRGGSVGSIATGMPLSIGSKPAGTTDQLAGDIDSVVITRG